MPTPDLQSTINALRQVIRSRRRALTVEQQSYASQALSQKLINDMPNNVKRVALYLANDGEINPLPFIQACWQRDIEVCLPVLHPFTAGQLLFLRYQTNTKMQRNKYNISEPTLDVRQIVLTKDIDVIYTPLVAFDSQGNRMGMGGGYYDRTLAANPSITTIGLAHDCQQVDALVPQIWDIALSQIITPTQQIMPLKDVKS